MYCDCFSFADWHVLNYNVICLANFGQFGTVFVAFLHSTFVLQLSICQFLPGISCKYFLERSSKAHLQEHDHSHLKRFHSLQNGSSDWYVVCELIAFHFLFQTLVGSQIPE